MVSVSFMESLRAIISTLCLVLWRHGTRHLCVSPAARNRILAYRSSSAMYVFITNFMLVSRHSMRFHKTYQGVPPFCIATLGVEVSSEYRCYMCADVTLCSFFTS